VSQAVVEAIATGSGSFIHGFTYSSHPISLAAGRAVLSYTEKQHLVNAADSERDGAIAAKLKNCLCKLRDVDFVGDVRGIGLLWAVEFVADKSTKAPFPFENAFSGRVAQAAIERGLLVYPVQGCADGDCGDHVLIAPPAVITEEQINWACEQLTAAIHEASSAA
jgi:adenosylmethionine-8-amino-7-oxononanoate aminotransferase